PIQCPVHPRHPHSFPTRRSSDLRSVSNRPTSCSSHGDSHAYPARPPSSANAKRGNGGALCFSTGRRSRAVNAGLKVSELKAEMTDRKSTRLNSSHLVISYAVFCL